MNTLVKLTATALVAAYLTACGGKNNQDLENQLLAGSCAEINNTTYITQTLEEGGMTENGVASMHWQVHFSEGTMTMRQSDFILTGSYYCNDNGDVIANINDTGEQALNFERHNAALYFDPLGGEIKTYLPTIASSSNACNLVKGNRYVESNDEAAKIVGNIPIESSPPFYTFGENQQVDYTAGDDIISRGVYECDTGALHIHAYNSDVKPELVSVAKDGKSISVNNHSSKILELVLEEEASAVCTLEYAPVCAVELDTIQCITEPCPIGSYKTYSNLCSANADKALYVSSGECGKLEGEVYEHPSVEGPVACTAQYDPVCGVELGTIQCITEPCPIGSYKTYSNLCTANAEKALFISNGECGASEGGAHHE